ncbi:MAG: GNAT family N-acetyltransferase [Pseudomonadota bacterium]
MTDKVGECRLNIAIRRAVPDDIPDIIELVRMIIFETYADLLAKNGEPPAGDPARWAEAHVALKGDDIVGVGLAREDFISDLWIERSQRNAGLGLALLDALENQIRSANHSRARLRVVASNHDAIRFYKRHGWREIKTYAHERDGHLMTGMEKELVIIS